MSDVLISQLGSGGAPQAGDRIEIERGTDPTNSSLHLLYEDIKADILSGFNILTITTLTTVTISAGVATIDLSNGSNRNFKLTLDQNATLAVINPPGAAYVAEFDLEISQNGTGGYTLTLPGSFKAIGPTDTAVAAGANAKTLMSAKSFDGASSFGYAMQERAA